MKRALRLLVFGMLAIACTGARADTASLVFKQIGIRTKDVLNSSVVTARVLPGVDKQVVSVVTYLTGKKGEADALGVRLDVFRSDGTNLAPVYTLDATQENGGFVGRGEVALLDLDSDGVNEIGLYYDNLKNPLIQDRRLDVIIYDGTTFRTVWTGSVSYDATKAVRDIPLERRDRYLRKLDVASTLRTKGLTLFMTKTVIAVAGERLPQPKQVQETFSIKTEPR